MRRLLTMLTVALLQLTCSDNGEGKQDNVSNKREKFASSTLSLGSDFSPFLDKSEDSIVFVFSERIAFDTSWILAVKKSEGNLYACYNQMLPSYHRDVHDYLEESSKLLAYDGLVFQLDITSFNTIITDTGLSSFMSKDTTPITCNHCPYYTLYYNSQVYRSTKQNQDFLNSVGEYLKSNVLRSLLEKRRSPRW